MAKPRAKRQVKYLLYANICIFLLGLELSWRLVERVRACEQGQLIMSSIAFAEVAWGSWNGKLPKLWVLTLVTNNEADFVDILTLRVENWTR